MNYQTPNVEESRTSRRKKSGKRAADETFASLDCAGAARTRLIAEELIEQLTRAQIGDLSDQVSVERLDHLNISLQLLAPAPTAQANLSTITSTSKEAHKLVRDLEESVNGRRGQRAQRRAESSLRLAAITQIEAERLLREDSAVTNPEATLTAPLEVQQQVEVAQSLPISPDAPVLAPESKNQCAQILAELPGTLAKKPEKKPELKSLGSLLKRPPVSSAPETTAPAPPKLSEEVVVPAPTALVVESQEQIEQTPVEEPNEEQLELNALMPAPTEVRNIEAQKISKANWQAAKEIAGGKESGALLLNIISEPERAVTDMLRQAKWTLKKWTE